MTPLNDFLQRDQVQTDASICFTGKASESLEDKDILQRIKLCLVKALVNPVLLYGSEA